MGSVIDRGEFIRSDMTSKAMGGTELLAHRLIDNVDKSILNKFQIHQSRVTSESVNTQGLKQILWVHDLAEDPAVAHLQNDGWKKYDLIVFVSHWQQEQYKIFLGVPYSIGAVIPNAITPIEDHEKPEDDIIRLVYTSTPHRGLNILYPIFEALSDHHNIELDVYSSFNLYGWGDRDIPYEPLFQKLKDHPKIRYHGSQSNDVVREALKKSDIFAYPSIWKETSCLCLIEAMSANLVCVHSSLGALPETSMGTTMMYEFTEDLNDHARRFGQYLTSAIGNVEHSRNDVRRSLNYHKPVIDNRYDVNKFGKKWEITLKGLLT